MQQEFRDFEFKSLEQEGEEHFIIGYASTWQVDSHNDRIVKGAYSKTIETRVKTGKVPFVSSHSLDAKDVLGTVIEAVEDEIGLLIKARISKAPSAQDTLVKIKEGHIKKMSVGFFSKASSYEKSASGESIRVIKDIELIEISAVPVPANDGAAILVAKELRENMEHKEIEIEAELKEDAEITEEKIESTTDEVKQDVVEAIELKQETRKEVSMEETKIVRKHGFGVGMKREVKQYQEFVEKSLGKTLDSVEAEAHMQEMNLLKQFLRGDIGAREMKAGSLSSNDDQKGGVLLPEILGQQIIQKLRDMVHMERLCSVYNINGAQFAIPTFDFDGTIPHTGEAATYTDASVDGFGKKVFVPQKRGIMIKVPDELLEDAENIVALQQFLINHYARRMGEIKENLLLNGTGASGEPEGLLTKLLALDLNVSSNTAVTFDKLVECMMDLKAQYRERATWLLPRDTLRAIRQLEDDAGLNMLQPRNMAAGLPAMLLGLPYVETEFVTRASGMGTVASGEVFAAVGDFSMYGIVNRNGLGVKVLEERYADEGLIGVRIDHRFDGGLLNAEAFSVLKKS